MSEYEARALARWRLGMIHYRRSGDAFVGDPIAEGMEEALDLKNYADEARRQRLVGPIDHALLTFCGWLAFSILRSLKR